MKQFLFSFLMLVGSLSTGFSQVLSADFAYTWSWSNPYEILLLDDIQGDYDQLTLEMGDGEIYNTTDVNHTYTEDGTYFIKLSVSDSNSGLSDSRVIPVVIPSIGCNLTFSYEPTGNPGEFVFSPVSGYIFPPQGTISWDFGDGTTATGTGLDNQVHTYSDLSQEYEVTISFDGASCDFSYAEVINPNNQADCFADFTFAPVSSDGMTYQFLDASFTASGENPSSVQWFFGEPANPSSTEFDPTFTYYDNGNYNVTYIINDEAGNCVDEVTKVVEVNGTPPLRANFFYVQPNFAGEEFNVVIAPLFTGNVTSLELDFGDGSPVLNEIPQLYTYTEPGVYEICITVFDEVNNLSDTYCLPIAVPWLGCNAVITYEQLEVSPNTYKFTSFYGSQPQPFLTYVWDFGDGSPTVTTTETMVFHTYEPGSGPEDYEVGLITIAANALGDVFCTSSFVVTVSVDGQVLSTKEVEEEELRIYPNPVSGPFIIETKGLESSTLEVQLYNMLGSLVFEELILNQAGANESFEVDPGSLPSGAYHLIVRGDFGQKVTQLVIQQ
jgi:PKD repeat protein